jgi:hypothetical protein
MMLCSYQLGQWATSKRVCVKGHMEARLQDLGAGSIFNWVLKKNFSICQNCPIKKRFTSFESMN